MINRDNRSFVYLFSEDTVDNFTTIFFRDLPGSIFSQDLSAKYIEKLGKQLYMVKRTFG